MSNTWLAVAMLAGCDAYTRDLGREPFLCGPTEPRCPDGYACMTDSSNGTEVCIASDGTLTPITCNDDSGIEPNDTLATAVDTGTDQATSFARDGLAICPASDKDTFSVTITSDGERIELTVAYDASGAALRGSILNTGGVPIATAASTPDAPRTLRTTSQGLRAGAYYVQVASSSTSEGAVNNYRLTVNILSP